MQSRETNLKIDSVRQKERQDLLCKALAANTPESLSAARAIIQAPGFTCDFIIEHKTVEGHKKIYSPLALASFVIKNEDIVVVLLEAGADPHYCPRDLNPKAVSVFDYAVTSNNWNYVQLFLQFSKHPPNPISVTIAIAYICSQRNPALNALIPPLIKVKPDLNYFVQGQPQKGVEQRFSILAYAGMNPDDAAFKELVFAGADPNVCAYSAKEISLITYLCEKKQWNKVTLLIESRKLNQENLNTALLYCLQQPQDDKCLVKLVLEQGAEAHHTFQYLNGTESSFFELVLNSTILISQQKSEHITLLLQYLKEETLSSERVYRILRHAIFKGNEDLINLFLNHRSFNTNPKAISMLIGGALTLYRLNKYAYDAAFIMRLMKYPFDVNALHVVSSNYSSTILHAAVDRADPLLTTCLLLKGANPDVKDSLNRAPRNAFDGDLRYWLIHESYAKAEKDYYEYYRFIVCAAIILHTRQQISEIASEKKSLGFLPLEIMFIILEYAAPAIFKQLINSKQAGTVCEYKNLKYNNFFNHINEQQKNMFSIDVPHREALAKAKEEMRIEQQASQFAKNAKCKLKVNCFKYIYEKLREKQSGFKSSNALDNWEGLTPNQMIEAVKKYVADKPKSRTAFAWRLAKQFEYEKNHPDLPAAIDNAFKQYQGIFNKFIDKIVTSGNSHLELTKHKP